ncbi:MAG: class I adenylate cyclase [Candidatus Symbiodolus clandestinus]
MLLAFDIQQQQLDALNQWRIDRALAAGTTAFQQIYQVLPLLLHYHHPRLPGYKTAEVPHGISLFQATAQQQKLLSAIFPGIQVDRLNGEEPPAIAAIYSMGSTASLGQTSASDLDLWICLQPDLAPAARNALQHKCQLLCRWGKHQGIELSFFMIDTPYGAGSAKVEQRARQINPSIHPLILDEFYRTHVRLAGKRLLWPLIPVEQEKNYQQYCTTLYHQRIIHSDHWIDFGKLPDRLPTDYLSIVQQQRCNNDLILNKLVLKNLLLESYAAEASKTSWCASTYKQQLQKTSWQALELDSYCQLLNHISHYLEQQGAHERLARIRRCFYRKICDHTNHPLANATWRQSLIRHLLQRWGWDQEMLRRAAPIPDNAPCKRRAIQYELLQEIKVNLDNLQKIRLSTSSVLYQP